MGLYFGFALYLNCHRDEIEMLCRCKLQITQSQAVSEMEKRADGADASVLFFSLTVLICCLYTRKLAKQKKHCATRTLP